MAKVITVMNMKGGVGKTVVAAHLAYVLALYEFGGKKRKVLAIDYDAQFNLSQMFIPSATYFVLDQQRKTSLAILQDDEIDLDPYELQVSGNLNPPSVQDIVHHVYAAQDTGTLDIIPSTLSLMYVALGQTTARTTPIEERFRKFVDACRNTYDVVIIDCHPAGSILTRTALQNSDHLIIPVTPSPFAARGINLMMQFADANKHGNTGPASHVLFNREGKDPSPSQLEIRGNPRYAKHCLATVVRESTFYSRPLGGENFLWWSGLPHWSRAAGRLHNLANEIVTRTGC